MKALNLKSMSWIMALAMMFIVSFTGCSDDDGEDGGPIAPVFPELKETNCGANETTEISFEANLDWEISSNAGWCKFIMVKYLKVSCLEKQVSKPSKLLYLPMVRITMTMPLLKLL